MSKDLDILQNCGGCAFETDIGECRFDRLNKFKKMGATIQQGDSAIIVGRKCNYFYPVDHQGIKDTNILAKEVVESNIVKTAIIIHANNTSYNSIKKTLDDCKYQSLLTPYIWIISNTYFVENEIANLKGDFPLARFKFQLIGKDDLIEPFVDSAVNRLSMFRYYVLVGAGHRLNNSVLSNIDKFINDDCGRFVYWDGGDFEVFHIPSHKMVGGHSLPLLDYPEATSLADKLNWWVNKNGTPDLIIRNDNL